MCAFFFCSFAWHVFISLYSLPFQCKQTPIVCLFALVAWAHKCMDSLACMPNEMEWNPVKCRYVSLTFLSFFCFSFLSSQLRSVGRSVADCLMNNFPEKWMSTGVSVTFTCGMNDKYISVSKTMTMMTRAYGPRNISKRLIFYSFHLNLYAAQHIFFFFLFVIRTVLMMKEWERETEIER